MKIFTYRFYHCNFYCLPAYFKNQYFIDPSVLRQIKPYKEEIKKFQQEVVGITNVVLEANRKKETNLGNLVTDSMVHWVNKYRNTLNLLNKGHSFQRTSLKFQRFFCCPLFLSLRYRKNLTSCPLFFKNYILPLVVRLIFFDNS